ncbi:hypothetical protein PoB_002235000 [Plakobranchus ocellatus]|uniref:Uncharacterized protein n=1 Tax=Plakobranchus ocellatus TaxID=259542 RepID=A0AAV3ZMS0_9GAST|nr:hypothetical protein PoB_002235000 [Plakobranchus ocellatus]
MDRSKPPTIDPCIIQPRKRTLKHRTLKQQDLNVWLSEYQRNYNRKRNDRFQARAPATWRLFYEAQIQRATAPGWDSSVEETVAQPGPEHVAQSGQRGLNQDLITDSSASQSHPASHMTTEQPVPVRQQAEDELSRHLSSARQKHITGKSIGTKTDSGKRRVADVKRPQAFSCLPWQQQLAQKTLENQGYARICYSCIKYR